MLLYKDAVLEEQQRSTEYLEQRYKIESQGKLFMELSLALYHTWIEQKKLIWQSFIEVVSDKENGVIMFTLVPHTTLAMQPLDTVVYGSLKTHWQDVCHKYLQENPGRVITKYQVFSKAWLKLYPQRASSVVLKYVVYTHLTRV